MVVAGAAMPTMKREMAPTTVIVANTIRKARVRGEGDMPDVRGFCSDMNPPCEEFKPRMQRGWCDERENQSSRIKQHQP